jgi:hypothetical protein
MQPMHGPRPTLAYDDLPAGSDIRREYLDRSVRISVPAGEPPSGALREAAYAALAGGAAASWALLVLAGAVFFYSVHANRVSGVPLLWARAFFAIFCAAAVMLVAWVRYGVMSDAIRAGRRQATALAAEAGRLIIETAGPFGVASYDLPATRIRSIAPARERLHDDRGDVRRVNCITIETNDGWKISLLPGRSPRELAWVASAVRERLQIPNGSESEVRST